MKRLMLIVFLFINYFCAAQYLKAEVAVGTMGYNGDLTQKNISFKRLRPGVMLDLTYVTGDMLNVRAGIGWGKITANDKDNPDPSLGPRNLNFTSNIFEFTTGVEYNIADPAAYSSYPYIFFGVGLFHFFPYTFDKDGKKVSLHALSTEGQGLKQYPDRKPYSLLQFCVPFGAGYRWKTKTDREMAVEFGYRITFTDYLDDVSKTYVDLEILTVEKGAKSAELSYRKNAPFTEFGEPRGNPTKKDLYYFLGYKVGFEFKKRKK